MGGEVRIVDDRVFLLGLDKRYREAMQAHERTELLRCNTLICGGLEILPQPEASNASFFWSAAKENIVVGRCVRLGSDAQRHYHWAIRTDPSGETVVHEFWEDEVWTTQRYSRALSSGRDSDLLGLRH